MNNIHNITCPGCDSPDHIENVINGEVWFHWKCGVCGTKMLTEKESGRMGSYTLVATHRDIVYEGTFYPSLATFRLEWCYSPGKWGTVFKLPFLPNFNANNFAQKLPTLLTFH